MGKAIGKVVFVSICEQKTGVDPVFLQLILPKQYEAEWYRMMRQVIAAILAGVLWIPTSALAQDAVQGADFTFKRVKVGQPSPGKRITVQIDPDEAIVYQTPPSKVNKDLALAPEDGPIPPELQVKEPEEQPDLLPKSDLYAWYWAGVSPSIGATGGNRLEQAVQYLDKGPNGQRVPTPRLQSMQDIAENYGIEILKATIGTQVSPALALAVISVESGGNSSAESHAGAQGLMQLISATADRFGVENRMEPSENIQGGVAYLDWLMGKFDGDPLMVLAAYNAGENAVLKNQGVPPFDETRAYVPKVLAAWTVARGLCMTPPQLISDGCVFAVKEAKNDS